MTLIVVTADDRGDLTVVADTLFGDEGRTGSEIGPKIFLVHVTISDLEKEGLIPLPNLGFAFAGNTLSGQFTHALASTCLQNLAGWVDSGKPDVEDVAKFYASCATCIFEERRRHRAFDSYGFEGLIFGFSDRRGYAVAYRFVTRVDPDGSCVAPIEEIVLEEDVPFPIGTGAPAARHIIDRLRQRRIKINPFALMDAVIRDVDTPSVGGGFQAATVDRAGVELRPVTVFYPQDSEGVGAEFSVMGINIHRLGMVAGFVPVGRPLHAQSAEDLTFISGDGPS